MHTDEIEKIHIDDLKSHVDAKSVLSKIKYVKQVGIGGKR